MWIFRYYIDKYDHLFKRCLCEIHKTIFNYIDKPPKRKKNEFTSDYALRIDKRHALRELKRSLLVTRVFNLNGLDDYYNENPSPARKQLCEIMRDQTEQYNLYKYLIKQISNS